MTDDARMCCPFCATISKGVRVSDDGSFLCVDCGFRGDAITRLMVNEGVSFSEATARFRGDKDGNEL
jgi:hypothetical protein